MQTYGKICDEYIILLIKKTQCDTYRQRKKKVLEDISIRKKKHKISHFTFIGFEISYQTF